MTDREHLIALQEIDTAIDQLRNRIDRLPERAAAAAAAEALAGNARDRAAAEAVRSAAEADLARTEAESAEIDAHRTRLAAQMKTIISPREAEALQKEMDTLADRRSALDDAGLEHLDAIGTADESIAVLDAALPALREADDAAAAALAAVVGDLEGEIAVLESRRQSAVDAAPAALVGHYESLRRTHKGTGVARLVGAQCTGCHLELSRAEAEQVRHVPDDQLPDCPSCGRVLLP